MRFTSIRARLTGSYSILILLVILIISIILSLIFSRQLIESSRIQLDQRISKIADDIQDQLMNVISICDDVKRDHEVVSALSLPRRENSGKDITSRLEEYYASISKNYLISRMILVNRNLEILDPVYTRVLYRDAILTGEDFTEFLSHNYVSYFAPPGTFPIDLESGYEQDALTVVLYQRLLDENYFLMGYLLAVMRKGILFHAIWEHDPEMSFAGISVFNHLNRSLFHSGMPFKAEELGLKLEEISGSSYLSTRIGKEKYLVFIKPISSVNWFVTGIIPYSVIFHDLNLALRSIVLIGLIFIFLAMMLSYFIAQKITHPLSEITFAMHAYDDSQILEKIQVKTDGELAYLVAVYNRLVGNINEFIQNIYIEQEKKKEAELRSLQYELDFLQAQINPHFIHNTLNAIGYQAEKAGNREVYRSLESFNILLRAAICGTGELIPVREELELVENYLRILQLRYGNNFSVVWQVPDEIQTSMVPKLILQPLVENAIIHGIGSSGNKGEVRINIFREEWKLFLKVRDNGAGMDRKIIETLKDPEKRKRRFNRVGLNNIEERVKILFGEEYGLSIQSQCGKGTEITVVIPFEKL
jgi:two-component system sensor histidine kinase YesM